MIKLEKISPQYRKLIVINAVFLILAGSVIWKVSQNNRANLVDLPVPIADPSYQSASTSPTTLLIPSIGVQAHIQHVGITNHGTMAVPNNYTDVGWYRYGYTPGKVGNAVVAGHLDNGGGRPAVFYDLSKLKFDDRVYVINDNGDKLEFKVTGMALYDYSSAPLDLIFGTSTKAHLNLITCDGVWNPAKKIYDKRLIITTDYVGIAKS